MGRGREGWGEGGRRVGREHTMQDHYKKHHLTPRYIGSVILVQGETLLPVPAVYMCTFQSTSKNANIPNSAYFTLYYCIAGTLGTPFSLQEKPSETEYLYLCTIIGTIQTHRLKSNTNASDLTA